MPGSMNSGSNSFGYDNNPTIAAMQAQAAQQQAAALGAQQAVAAQNQTQAQQASTGFQNYMNDQTKSVQANPINLQSGMLGAQQIGNTNTDASRIQQMQALGLIQGAAQGNAPSAAQIQMNQGLNQALMQQMAAANSGAGGFNPAMSRLAMIQGANQMQTTSANSAALRAQEMAAARDQYAQQAAGLRSQDIGLANNQANLNYQIGSQNIANQNAMQQFNVGANNTRQGQVNDLQSQYLQAQLGFNGQSLQQQQAAAALQAQKDAAAQAQQNRMIGGIASAAGGIAGAFVGGAPGAAVGSSIGSGIGGAVSK